MTHTYIIYVALTLLLEDEKVQCRQRLLIRRVDLCCGLQSGPFLHGKETVQAAQGGMAPISVQSEPTLLSAVIRVHTPLGQVIGRC